MASSSTKKVKSSFTNTSGQRVTSYSDGTKKVSGSVTNTAKVGDTVNGKKVGYTAGGNAYSSSKNAPGYSDTFEGKGEDTDCYPSTNRRNVWYHKRSKRWTRCTEWGNLRYQDKPDDSGTNLHTSSC